MKVRIYKPHTHNRVRLVPGPAGIAIDVSLADATFLKQHGVLDPPKRAPAPAVATPDQVEPPDA
jgi:hypothetical protein